MVQIEFPDCPKCGKVMPNTGTVFSRKPKFQGPTRAFTCGQCEKVIVIQPPLICPDHQKEMEPVPGQKYKMGASQPRQKFLVYLRCSVKGCNNRTTLEVE